MVRVLVIMFAVLSVFRANCYGEGLDSLIEVGKSQDEIQKKYISETAAYKAVVKGVDSGRIKKGMTRQDIMKAYGDPVIVVNDSKNSREKWVYKPATSSFLDGGPKLNLYFIADGTLNEIENEK